MSKKKESKSNTPVLIIVAVLVAAVLGGWWFYSSSKPAPSSSSNRAANTANTANTARTSAIPPNAPPGAQPPNQSGSPAAAVKLEEFADFQCGSCAVTNPIFNEVKSMYGSRIHFVFRHYPLPIPAHAKAYDAAVAAEAAGLQGRFWDMQNQLFVNQQAWSNYAAHKDLWKGYAEKIGLDVPRWEADMAGIAARSRVDEDIKRGKAIGVNSTPTLYVNGMAVPPNELNVQSLKTIIDAELGKAAQQRADTPGAGQQQPAANSK